MTKKLDTKNETKNDEKREDNIIESLESYIHTGNEHYDSYSLEFLCEVLQSGLFENPEISMKVYSESLDKFEDLSENPIQALNNFNKELENQKFTKEQQLFICTWLHKYLRNTEYESLDLSSISKLIKAQKEKLESENTTPNTFAKNIRETLKALIQKEIESLPTNLKSLEPDKRISILCKLIPFVLPKIESVHYEVDEKDKQSGGIDWANLLK